MVIDSSALVAIIFRDPEARTFAMAIRNDPTRLLSEVSWVEASIVILHRRGEAALTRLHHAVELGGIQRVPVDDRLGRSALEAFRRFGKGRHPAALNLGDCFSYALAKTRGEPLLFKGRDFGRTDLASVI